MIPRMEKRRNLSDLPLPTLLRSLCETVRLLGPHSPSTAVLQQAIVSKFQQVQEARRKEAAHVAP
jgi:hypothetical protein